MLSTKKTGFEFQVKFGQPVIKLTQLSFNESITITDIDSFQRLIDNGGKQTYKTLDGQYIEVHYNTATRHLRSTKNVINTFLTDNAVLNGLKHELTELQIAVYLDDTSSQSGPSW
jgi:hypothetical protein